MGLIASISQMRQLAGQAEWRSGSQCQVAKPEQRGEERVQLTEWHRPLCIQRSASQTIEWASSIP